MTDKQEVIDLLRSLPEDASLEEIVEEPCIMAAVRRGRTAIAEGRTKTHEEVKQLVEFWFTHNSTLS